MHDRRQFLAASAAATAGLTSVASRKSDAAAPGDAPSWEALTAAARQPVLNADGLDQPVRLQSVELLRNGRVFVVRVRTPEGDEGIAVPNASRLIDTYPIFLNRVAPYLISKDARHWEEILTGLYRYRSNYKFQGLAFWVCVTAAELAVLDLLGKRAGKSIGELLGGVRRTRLAVYRASGNRGNRPEEEVEYLQQLLAETGAAAVKFRVGGRMSDNRDSRPGRTEQLIPLVRKTLGDHVTIYADSNSSYDARNAIRVGRIMEAHDYGFFEEPCRFDHLEETRQVSEALRMPVAGGEQEFSHWRFQRMIHDRVVDIVQPDLHYYGGFVRAMRVARMAALAGMPCTVHMSGSGLGYLDAIHFASCCPDPGAHQEFKGEGNLPVHCDSSSLRCENGFVTVPSGPGFGVELDPRFLEAAEPVR